jgi:hypothetical protein
MNRSGHLASHPPPAAPAFSVMAARPRPAIARTAVTLIPHKPATCAFTCPRSRSRATAAHAAASCSAAAASAAASTLSARALAASRILPATDADSKYCARAASTRLCRAARSASAAAEAARARRSACVRAEPAPRVARTLPGALSSADIIELL